MSTDNERVVGVCWFCGQLWARGCPGERMGHGPVIMTLTEMMDWKASGQPPRLVGNQVLSDWQWPGFSPVENAFRRGFHHAMSLVTELYEARPLRKRDVEILEQIACEFRYSNEPIPWYTQYVAVEFEKRSKRRKTKD